MNTFEDISIIHSGACSCPNPIPEFRTAIRSNVTTLTIKWQNSESYDIQNEGTTVQYTGGGWGPQIFSQQIKSTSIVYFQMRITEHGDGAVADSGGIVLGISDNAESRSEIVMLNTVSGISGYTCFNATTGDVIGVVVDMKNDVVQFYKNGRYEGVGIAAPSTIGPMYAVLELYYSNSIIEMGDFIKFHKLERYCKTQARQEVELT